MDTAITRRNLPMMLLRARERIMVRFRPLLKAHGVTEQQWRVVRALHEHGAAEPRELCDLCALSGPSLAGILARMEALGLIDRRRFDHDRRRVRVSLTRRSTSLVHRVSAEIEARYRELERTVGSETVARTYACLEALVAGLDGSPPRSLDGHTAEFTPDADADRGIR
ncbi:MAG TPA: homoprotocatechuate degradation operon regulator HpaR [Nevskiaceae bacterium]